MHEYLLACFTDKQPINQSDCEFYDRSLLDRNQTTPNGLLCCKFSNRLLQFTVYYTFDWEFVRSSDPSFLAPSNFIAAIQLCSLMETGIVLFHTPCLPPPLQSLSEHRLIFVPRVWFWSFCCLFRGSVLSSCKVILVDRWWWWTQCISVYAGGVILCNNNWIIKNIQQTQHYWPQYRQLVMVNQDVPLHSVSKRANWSRAAHLVVCVRERFSCKLS